MSYLFNYTVIRSGPFENWSVSWAEINNPKRHARRTFYILQIHLSAVCDSTFFYWSHSIRLFYFCQKKKKTNWFLLTPQPTNVFIVFISSAFCSTDEFNWFNEKLKHNKCTLFIARNHIQWLIILYSLEWTKKQSNNWMESFAPFE